MTTRPPSEESRRVAVLTAYDTVRRMVASEGCAWHAVQTHESLVPYLIEETAEFIDAVESGAPAAEIAGELGDVLYQVLFHAAIAQRDAEGYDLELIDEMLTAKLIARHPHVFGDRGYMSVEELNAEWERLKEAAVGAARGSRGVLEGIPASMPTLARAAKVVERLKRAGLVQPTELAAKLRIGAAAHEATTHEATTDEATTDEATTEKAAAHEAVFAEATISEEMIGDELLALVMRANVQGVDVDRALRLATSRLIAQHLPTEPSE